MVGYTPVMPKLTTDDIVEKISKATSNTIPKNIIKTWYDAENIFKNNGEEYIEAWREAYITLCVEDGSIKYGWTNDGIIQAILHYYNLWDKYSSQYSYADYPEINIFDPDTFSIKPLSPPPKKP